MRLLPFIHRFPFQLKAFHVLYKHCSYFTRGQALALQFPCHGCEIFPMGNSSGPKIRSGHQFHKLSIADKRPIDSSPQLGLGPRRTTKPRHGLASLPGRICGVLQIGQHSIKRRLRLLLQFLCHFICRHATMPINYIIAWAS